MNEKKAFLFLLALSLISITALSAQQKERELTVEELYLKSIEAQILREKAFSDDQDMKMGALDDIEKMADEGGAAAEGPVFVLEYLAMEGVNRRVHESNRLINYFPEVRRRAANLLGRLGGEQAKNTLITVLITDDEPMVKAEAAYALGVIGKNEDYRSSDAIVFMLNREDSEKPDNNFAFAICLAFEKIAKANGGFKDYKKAAPVYSALIRIAQGNYIRTVKQKALQTLDELKKYQ